MGWRLFDDSIAGTKLTKAANGPYENDVALVAAKILMRGEAE